ncbi:MAG TPA: hypothetical protein PL151_03010 [Phycisphaerae bacterium]|nr:hypothetical protein [Phycisphaerae bacterium]HOJ72475.1 hypothetical protein [Phycisphaerae bacterium]HOM49863.1 hypothetical protein [Phycisphaerae bacterium]HOQ84723.1 hypothetical protein [Phycisphaerae bacterium]HPP26291.1 hypothetical protein [Phycisphaerae bacterium]
MKNSISSHSAALVSVLMGLMVGLASHVTAAAQTAATAETLRAGAATSNITPWLGISMNGHFTDRKAVHVHDELHARALVLDDGRTRLALVACDSCVIHRDIFDEAKRLAEQATGIPAAHMLMCATHTHTGATCTAIFSSEPDPAYQEFLIRRIADAVTRAAHNCAPARIGWGSGHKPDHLFNRRWYMKEGTIPANPFGETTDRVRMNPPRQSPDLLEPAGPTDPQVGVLSVRSNEGRPLAVLANYGLHYIGDTGPAEISADYFGAFADRIQALLDADRLDPPFVGILTNGASGDVNNINFRQPAVAGKPYTRIRAVADDLAGEVARVIRAIDHRSRAALVVRQTEITLGVRRPNDADLERARSIIAAAEGRELKSPEEVFANETIKLADYPSTVDVPLQVIRIGDAAIVAIPCEVFAEIGLEIKQKSPIKPTFVISLANGYNGYLPTPAQHALGGYETWRARSSYLEVDAAPKIVEQVLALLHSLPTESR